MSGNAPTKEDIIKKYPELDSLVMPIADMTTFMINRLTRDCVSKEMPYKAQYVLEEVIKVLEERV